MPPSRAATRHIQQPFHHRLAAVFAGEFASKAAVTVALILLARTLTPRVYGEAEWVLSLIWIFTIVADAGLSRWAAAEIAVTPGHTAALIGQVGWMRVTLAAAAYALLLVVAAVRGGDAGRALAVCGLGLLVSPFFLQYVFDGLFQPTWGALGQAVRGVTFATVALSLARADSPPAVVALADVAGAAALALCHIIVLRGVLHIRPAVGRPNRDAFSILGRSWPVGASELMSSVFWFGGAVLLGYLSTSTDVAWYAASLRIVMALHTAVWLYFTVLLPNLARQLRKDGTSWTSTVDRSIRLTSWIGCGLAASVTIGASAILTALFGPSFASAAPALRVVAWVVPILWCSGHLRFSFIAAGQPRKDSRAAGVGAAVTVGLTVALVPAFGSLGAALALLGGAIANAMAAVRLAVDVLPAAALSAGFLPGLFASAVTTGLGAILTPIAGAWLSAVVAGGLPLAVGLIRERNGAREFLHLVGRSAPPTSDES